MSRAACKAFHSVAKEAGLRRGPRRTLPKGTDPAHHEIARLHECAGNNAVNALLGGGVPLDPGVRAEMEARFGESFANVRVHDDDAAHRSTAGLEAKAYTVGNDVAFSVGRYAPHEAEGKRLLAHELAHVVQQRRGGAQPTLDSRAPHEQSAAQAASAVVANSDSVAVNGGTAVGVAREEDDDSFRTRLRGNLEALKETIPPLPLGSLSGGDIESLLNASEKLATGAGDPVDDLKAIVRNKVQETIGATKGVVTQVTEVVDTGLWLGREYKAARDKAAEAIGGDEGSTANTAAKKAIDVLANATILRALPGAAKASDQLKALGLVDERGEANLSAPLAEIANAAVKWTEEAIGGTPSDPELFTRAEVAEIKASIAVQVVLAFTGAEEVKIAMNVIGALGGLRGVVESVRHEPDWKTSPRFWGSIIGLVLSVVGLKHSLAASKITTLVLKYGWVAAAIPPMAQMVADYVNTEITEEERERRMKQDWIQVVGVLKDAILHVAQSRGGKAAAPKDTPPATKGKTGAAVDVATPPADKVVQPAAKTGTTETTPQANKLVPPATTGGATETKLLPQATTQGGSTPLKRSTPPRTSAASKKLQANLDKLPPERVGTVTPLPRRKTGKPPTDPAQQKVPVAQEEPQTIAVGQTHGPGSTKAPALKVVGGEAPVASASRGGGKRAGTAPSTTASVAPGVSKTTAARGGKSAAGKKSVRGKTQAPEEAPATTPTKKGAVIDPIEVRLRALKVPPKKRAAFNEAAKQVLQRAKTDPESAEQLLKGLEKRFGDGKPPGGKRAEVLEDIGEAQNKLYAEKGPSGKHTQSPASDERAQLEQAKPSPQRVRQDRTKESEQLGETGGARAARRDGIRPIKFNPPQKYKGLFGRGIDGLGKSGSKTVVLEWKYRGSALRKGSESTQMSTEWVGKKIAELYMAGDRKTARSLLKAADEGNLQGAVYRTRKLKSGEVSSRERGAQLRDKLDNESITDDGLINYSGKDIRAAYETSKAKIEADIASGKLPALGGL